MKKLSILLVAMSSIISVSIRAQKQTSLTTFLPKTVLDKSPVMQNDVSSCLGKLNTMNPGLKNKSDLNTQIKKVFLEYKVTKPELSNFSMPVLNSNSFDDLIATKEKELGAKSPFVGVLRSLKADIDNAADDDDVISGMCTTMQSSSFSSLSVSDRNVFYNAFASVKMVVDYGRTNKLIAAVIPVNYRSGFGGFVSGSENPEGEYGVKLCHWAVTMVGAIIGAAAGGPFGAVAGGVVGFGVGAGACYN
jgi:hypothetical protein